MKSKFYSPATERYADQGKKVHVAIDGTVSWKVWGKGYQTLEAITTKPNHATLITLAETHFADHNEGEKRDVTREVMIEVSKEQAIALRDFFNEMYPEEEAETKAVAA